MSEKCTCPPDATAYSYKDCKETHPHWNSSGEFMECSVCRALPGTPALCKVCLTVRADNPNTVGKCIGGCGAANGIPSDFECAKCKETRIYGECFSVRLSGDCLTWLNHVSSREIADTNHDIFIGSLTGEEKRVAELRRKWSQEIKDKTESIVKRIWGGEDG